MQPNNTMFSYDQEEAVKAGGGEYITEGGAYKVKITEAKYIEAKTKSKAIEFSVITSEGQKANYLTCYYEKANGEKITGGSAVISAMMGIAGIQNLTAVRGDNCLVCPEFKGKVIGTFLQKVLYTKSDGKEGFKFEIRVPYDSQNGCTLKEKLSNAPAQTIGRLSDSYKDRDERNSDNQNGATPWAQNTPPPHQQAANNSAPSMDSFDDDIPF